METYQSLEPIPSAPPSPPDAGSTSPGNSPADELRRLSRRSFTTGGISALAGLAGLWWLNRTEREDGLPWPLRKVLEFNERISQTYYGPERLAPTFDRSLAAEPRVNGKIGLEKKLDLQNWRLEVFGPEDPPIKAHSLTLEQIQQLPRHEIVTEFKCVEGWSQIVQWAGARLPDFIDQFGQSTPYVGLATPDRKYYVGLDQESVLHSQSLLAWEMNGQPLTPGHGAPLRLVCPLKYGVKSIKRIGVIHCTELRPADYWAERGYDWYLGH